MIIVEISTGKTRFFRDVIEYLEATEDGFQGIIADDIGTEMDPSRSNVQKYQDDYLSPDLFIELPEPPEDFYIED